MNINELHTNKNGLTLGRPFGRGYISYIIKRKEIYNTLKGGRAWFWDSFDEWLAKVTADGLEPTQDETEKAQHMIEYYTCLRCQNHNKTKKKQQVQRSSRSCFSCFSLLLFTTN